MEVPWLDHRILKPWDMWTASFRPISTTQVPSWTKINLWWIEVEWALSIGSALFRKELLWILRIQYSLINLLTHLIRNWNQRLDSRNFNLARKTSVKKFRLTLCMRAIEPKRPSSNCSRLLTLTINNPAPLSLCQNLRKLTHLKDLQMVDLKVSLKLEHKPILGHDQIDHWMTPWQ